MNRRDFLRKATRALVVLPAIPLMVREEQRVNLRGVTTGRFCSEKPNFQNLPRDIYSDIAAAYGISRAEAKREVYTHMYGLWVRR